LNLPMIYKIFSILLVIVFFIASCQPNTENDNLPAVQIKKLEFSREPDTLKWRNAYLDARPDLRMALIESIGKTRDKNHAGFLVELFNSESDKELINEIIFALGQLKDGAGESALLGLNLERFDKEIQHEIIAALGRCGSKKSSDFLNSLLEKSELYNAILNSAALLARRNINTYRIYRTVTDTASSFPASDEFFYYLSYYKGTDPVLMVSKLTGTNDVSRKAAYKFLSSKLVAHKGNLFSFLKNDTLAALQLEESLKSSLTGKQNWDVKYNGIHLLSLIGDSTHIPLLETLSTDNNIHVQIAAYQAYSRLFGSDALGFLMTALQSADSWYTKGELIKEISKISPKKAFPFINNNLDKGDTSFRVALLEALGNMNYRLADTQIRQFLNVPNPAFQNTAFTVLQKKRKLRTADVDALLDADAASTIYLALNWKLKRKIKTDPEKLFDLFRKFDHPNGFDVQQAVAQTLTFFKAEIKKDVIDSLTASIHDKKIYSEFKYYHNLIDTSKIVYRNTDPSFLEADSITTQEFSKAQIKTNKGAITIDFHSGAAPLTVKNFTRLAEKGYFEGIIFHRVVADFVIQAGDPGGDGFGGPGYSIPSEDNRIPYARGSVGMATAGWDTGGSQFFICHSPQPHLTGGYTLFAEVSQGMEVVDQITVGDRIIEIILFK